MIYGKFMAYGELVVFIEINVENKDLECDPLFSTKCKFFWLEISVPPKKQTFCYDVKSSTYSPIEL